MSGIVFIFLAIKNKEEKDVDGFFFLMRDARAGLGTDREKEMRGKKHGGYSLFARERKYVSVWVGEWMARVSGWVCGCGGVKSIPGLIGII